MKKIVTLLLVLMLVAVGVSATPKAPDSSLPTFVAAHASHVQVLGGNSGEASVKGLLNAAAHSHGVLLVVKDGGDGGKGDNPK